MDRTSSLRPDLPLLRSLDSNFTPGGVMLDRDVCVVGRSYVHLPLLSIEVSRTHALLVKERRSIYIRDLASKNGVYRNNEPVREAELLQSDVLRIGPVSFRCESGFQTSESSDREPQEEPADAHIMVDGTSITLPVSQRTFLIGTRDGCDAAISGTGVSPVHAIIFRRGTRHFVRDLNSKLGTFLNGNRVRESRLSAGDEIRVGTIALCYGLVAPEAAPPGDAFGKFNVDVAIAPEVPASGRPPVEASHPSRPTSNKDVMFGAAATDELQTAASLRPAEHVVDGEDLTIGLQELVELAATEKTEQTALQIRSADVPDGQTSHQRSDRPEISQHMPLSFQPLDAPVAREERHPGEESSEADMTRAQKVQVEKLLGRLSRNVVRLKSAWRTLYAPPGHLDLTKSAKKHPR